MGKGGERIEKRGEWEKESGECEERSVGRGVCEWARSVERGEWGEERAGRVCGGKECGEGKECVGIVR